MAYWSPRLSTVILGLGIGVGLILSGCEVAEVEGTVSESKSLPIRLVDEAAPLGDQPEQPLFTVVGSPEEWDALEGSLPAQAIAAGMRASADLENLVLVVFAGQKPSSGFRIAVEGIYPQDDVYLVRVEETLPGPEQITEPAVTLPYQVIAISRNEFPEAADITFVFQDTQNKELARTTINSEAPYPVP